MQEKNQQIESLLICKKIQQKTIPCHWFEGKWMYEAHITSCKENSTALVIE